MPPEVRNESGVLSLATSVQDEASTGRQRLYSTEKSEDWEKKEIELSAGIDDMIGYNR